MTGKQEEQLFELLTDILWTLKKIKKDKVNMLPGGMLETGLTEMPQCMPDEYKDKCSIQAYWNYYIGEKHTIANPKTEKIYERRPQRKNKTI